MKKLILLAYLFCECLCGAPVVNLDSAKPYYVEVKEENSVPNTGDTEILNATLFKTVKSYYCRARIDGDEELILFGTKAWMFPAQNVNLTLRYPSENHPYEDKVDYVLTRLRVVLHLSGNDFTKGFITSGGMHQDHISMTFLLRNLTSLRYQFYLHGMPRRLCNRTENYTAVLTNLC